VLSRTSPLGPRHLIRRHVTLNPYYSFPATGEDRDPSEGGVRGGEGREGKRDGYRPVSAAPRPGRATEGEGRARAPFRQRHDRAKDEAEEVAGEADHCPPLHGQMSRECRAAKGPPRSQQGTLHQGVVGNAGQSSHVANAVEVMPVKRRQTRGFPTPRRG